MTLPEVHLNSYPGHLVAASVALLLLGVTFAVYGVLKKRASRPLTVLLELLRATTILLLLLVLFDPIRILRRPIAESINVVTCIDRSRSMSIPDAGGGATRFDRAAELVSTRLMPPDEHVRNTLAVFAGTLVDVDSLDGQTADGNGTDLVRALRHMHAESDRADMGVLLSDGNATRGGDPIDFVRAYGGRVPIHTVGLGGREGSPDIGIAAITAPESVTVGDEIPVDVTIFQRGMTGERAVLILEHGGEPVLVRNLALSDREFQRLSLVVKSDTTGWNDYRLVVRAPDAGSEFSRANNAAHFTLQVAKRESLKVLYIESSLRWTVRFLRATLETDDDIRLSVRLDIAPPERVRERDTLFPSARRRLFDYDVVILGDLRKGYLTPDDQSALYDFVSLRGGGLAVVGGLGTLAERGYINTDLARLLPVLLDARSASVPAAPVRSTPVITDEGRNHPIMAPLIEAGCEFPDLWKIKWDYAAKPSATILAATKETGAPLLLCQRFGRGHVLLTTGGFMWNWAFPRPKQTDDDLVVFDQFWRRAVRWLGRNPGARARFRLYAEKEFYNVGEPVHVFCDVRNEDYRPDPNAEVTLKVADSLYAMEPEPRRPGRYHAELVATDEQSHVLRANISRDGALIGEARTVLRIVRQDEESEHVALNETTLREISRLSGGTYFHEDELPELGKLLEGVQREEVYATDEFKLWDRWPVFFILVGLLFVEWMIRRRRGLA